MPDVFFLQVDGRIAYTTHPSLPSGDDRATSAFPWTVQCGLRPDASAGVPTDGPDPRGKCGSNVGNAAEFLLFAQLWTTVCVTC
jgi:hypothetical protein